MWNGRLNKTSFAVRIKKDQILKVNEKIQIENNINNIKAMAILMSQIIKKIEQK